MESKKEILEGIKNAGKTKGSNSMGVSESYYNPYYLIKTCFEFKDLEAMTEEQLQALDKLAKHATEVFY